MDRNLALAVGRGSELFDHCFILSARNGKNIKVSQYGCAIDVNIELPDTDSVVIDLRKVQANGVVGAHRQVGEGVAEVVIRPLRLVDC